MIEHRLIEKMLIAIEKKLETSEKEDKIDPYLIDKAVDFIRIYADKTHHGKEEDILFRELRNKKLSKDDNEMMEELIKDHVFGRETTKSLVTANTAYRNGDTSALKKIKECLRTLIDFYPKHIKKEDDVFFPASHLYFSQVEEEKMLTEFWEFDRKMIHEKYKLVVEETL